ncbi:trk system potassium uptake protein TrkH [Phyllobacterium sp. YR620]|uniref:TrkH family potassium uptake protein n=1 Tax=Phyllobacterium sp. YR620 TaxID=1881066 RepID=UPI00088EE229|nr:TrkH family potassium uptake protein [Phyllobacterium sp. YR620]SDO84318.1 trk system potassium uptake protein TrkH [Phyllobacterium sp. YR620]
MAATMLIPALIDLKAGSRDWLVFVQAAGLTAVLCWLTSLATHQPEIRFTPRLGFLLIVALWLSAAVFGALPFIFSPLPISIIKAFFESMSGITATGATVLTGLDRMPRGILLWRSMLCWFGGLGFIGLGLLLLPSLRVGGIQLLHMESSDKSEKILPRIHQIATGIVLAYVSLTLICTILYFVAGMGMFDAINHGMTTVATAGFSTHDSSLGFYAHNRAILIIATVFMILGALPFVLYIKAAMPQRRVSMSDPQVTLFFIIIVSFSAILAAGLMLETGIGLVDAIIAATFNLVSVITTTGFATEDYTLWGAEALGIFFLVTFIGSCSGSTSGGIKINRLIILWQMASASLTRLILPNAIVKMRYGKSEITDEVAQSALLFIFLYMASLVAGATVLAMLGNDLGTAFTGALTALSNVGPGFGETIGPAGNFSTIGDPSLLVLSYLMLAGRLEIVTVVILFTRRFWTR